MPRLMDIAKIEKAVELFNEKIVKHYPGNQYSFDIFDENWYAVAVGFFVGLNFDVFEVDAALSLCREKKYMWDNFPDKLDRDTYDK